MSRTHTDFYSNIFLVEGIITVGWGILMIWLFPTDPENSKMLNEEERALAIRRMYVDQPSIGTTKEKATKKLVKRGVFSVTTIACSWCVLCRIWAHMDCNLIARRQDLYRG